MKRKIVCLVIFSFLISSIGFASWASSFLLKSSVSTTEWLIVPTEKPTIQSAIMAYINNLYAGILVKKNNTYTEKNIIIPKNHSQVLEGLVLKGEDAESTIIDGNGATAVILIEVADVTITGFTISNSTKKSDDASGILISSEGSRCNITGNIVKNNRNGIYLNRSGNCIISQNLIVNNTGDNIRLYGSTSNKIEGNRLIGNAISTSVGLDLSSNSDNNVIVDNDITGNDMGIYIHYSRFSLICGNNITESDRGIRIYSASNNTIYHNNFVNDTRPVTDDGADYPNYISVNSWDCGYPCGGNYWSDFKDIDICWGKNQSLRGSDMIIDTKHTIYALNEDGYPLFSPWPMPGFHVFYAGNYSIAGKVYENYLLVLTNCSVENLNFDWTLRQMSFDLNSTEISGFSLIVPKQVLDGAFGFFVDDDPAAFSIMCSDNEHMMNSTLGSGNYKVKIVGEFADRLPIRQFPDINGDDAVNIIDITIVARHFLENLQHP